MAKREKISPIDSIDFEGLASRKPMADPVTGKTAQEYTWNWFANPRSQERLQEMSPKRAKRTLYDAGKNIESVQYLENPLPGYEGDVKGMYDPYAHGIINLEDSFKTDLHETFHATGIGQNPDVQKYIRSQPVTGATKQNIRNPDHPDEVYARIMELRHQMNLTPGLDVTPDMLPGTDGRANELFQHYKDDDIVNMMNDLAVAPAPANTAEQSLFNLGYA